MDFVDVDDIQSTAKQTNKKLEKCSVGIGPLSLLRQVRIAIGRLFALLCLPF
jgi:hypothetical protein